MDRAGREDFQHDGMVGGIVEWLGEGVERRCCVEELGTTAWSKKFEYRVSRRTCGRESL